MVQAARAGDAPIVRAWERRESIDAVLAAGADPTEVNDDGRSPTDLVRAVGREDPATRLG
jgi:hypothetical protein